MTQEPTLEPIFKIKSWDAYAVWSWDIDTDSCAICRNYIMSPCIECLSNPNRADTLNCTVAWGKCSHAFHFHCISRWLTTRNVRPITYAQVVRGRLHSTMREPHVKVVVKACRLNAARSLQK
uniref:RING-box protein pip1 n=1 Tax=Lygus hesperus TaxID=30085 RepID=A0A0A9WMS8_LYGHE